MRVLIIFCFATPILLACKDPFKLQETQYYLVASGQETWISPDTHLPNRTSGYFRLDCTTRGQERYKRIALYQADPLYVWNRTVPIESIPVAYTDETNETDWWFQPITTSCPEQIAFWINMHRGFAFNSQIATSYRIYDNSPQGNLMAYVEMAENDPDFVVIRSAETQNVVASAMRVLAPGPMWNVSNTGGLQPMIPGFLLMLKDSEHYRCPNPAPAETSSISVGGWVGIGFGIAAAVGVTAGLAYRWYRARHFVGFDWQSDSIVASLLGGQPYP